MERLWIRNSLERFSKFLCCRSCCPKSTNDVIIRCCTNANDNNNENTSCSTNANDNNNETNARKYITNIDNSNNYNTQNYHSISITKISKYANDPRTMGNDAQATTSIYAKKLLNKK